MNKSILFVINGFGMGNATRCDSLMDVLSSDYQIDVITSDKAYLYYRQNSKVKNVYKQVDLNLENKIEYGSFQYYRNYIPHFFKRLLKNYKIQKKIMNSKKYDYVIFDSDYGFVIHKILTQTKNIVAINNSYEVIHYFLKNPKTMKPNLTASLFLEICDFFIHYVFCRYIICPCLDINTPQRKSVSLHKVLLSPPLVRRSLIKNKTSENNTGGILVTSSTSNIRASFNVFKKTQNEFKLDNTQLLTGSSLVVCNAGQSTLAECLYLNKKTLVAAIPKHAEQYVNSLIVQNKGMSVYLADSDPEILSRNTPTVEYNYNYDHSVKTIQSHFKTIYKEIYDHLC